MRNFRISERSSNSITVLFEPPHPPHGILESYTLQYWPKAKESDIITITLQHNSGTYVASNLPTYVTFAFKVVFYPRVIKSYRLQATLNLIGTCAISIER